MPDTNAIRLLVADDDQKIATLYKEGLERHFDSKQEEELANLRDELFGGEDASNDAVAITVCSQGDTAVSLAKESHEAGTPFDVIVLDIRMPPGINGVEAAEKIREFDTNVPIIFVSGYSDFGVSDIEERVPPCSLMYYIEKPIQLTQLAERIKVIVPR